MVKMKSIVQAGSAKSQDKKCSADSLYRFIKYIIGFDKLTRKVVRAWTLQQRLKAKDYFIAVLAELNDNDVVVPPKPKFLNFLYK